jgi:hypothetical protein
MFCGKLAAGRNSVSLVLGVLMLLLSGGGAEQVQSIQFSE